MFGWRIDAIQSQAFHNPNDFDRATPPTLRMLVTLVLVDFEN